MATEKHVEIAKLAYGYWELEGRPDGRAVDHWLRAEELINGRSLKENARRNKKLEHAAGHVKRDSGRVEHASTSGRSAQAAAAKRHRPAKTPKT